MRGEELKQSSMVTLISPSSMVPMDHPIRSIKIRADAALKAMSPLFDQMYAQSGRASIPPETLLKGQLLIALYSLRSERQLCEQVAYNLLFRWFLDMDMTASVFDPSTYSKNRKRLLAHDACREFFKSVLDQAEEEGLLSDDHFSVDGSLIEAWASMKSFVPKDEVPADEPQEPKPPKGGKGGKTAIKKRDRNAWKDFSGTKRSNETHVSTTDPEARLARKGAGQSAKLSFSMHAMMEHRNGFLKDIRVNLATGTAETDTASDMIAAVSGSHQITVAGDKGYDSQAFVESCRMLGATPHVIQNTGGGRSSAIDGRTTETPGYQMSLRARMFIESIFGWLKTVGGARKTRFKGRERTGIYLYMAGAAYNLLRMARLAPV
jgi:transposase